MRKISLLFIFSIMTLFCAIEAMAVARASHRLIKNGRMYVVYENNDVVDYDIHSSTRKILNDDPERFGYTKSGGLKSLSRIFGVEPGKWIIVGAQETTPDGSTNTPMYQYNYAANKWYEFYDGFGANNPFWGAIEGDCFVGAPWGAEHCIKIDTKTRVITKLARQPE